MFSHTIAHLSPGRVVLAFTFLTILAGTLLLALPIARTAPISFLDLFFTATSSTCVTGMFTIPLDQFTLFGHSIILALMQIGGLGLITLTLFVLHMLFDLGFGTQILAGHILEIESWKQVRKILMYIVCITLIVEAVGTICIFWCIKDQYHIGKALFLSLFHSVSSFCNAGITLFSPEHLKHISTDYNLLSITAILMLIGSLGFITWIETLKAYKAWRLGKRFAFSLSTKIIFWSSIILIAIPALIMLILEYNSAFAHLNWTGKIINAFVNSIALRSTGFLTVALPQFQMATLLMIMAVSFIGAAPGSTGSGIKITTCAVLLEIIKSTLQGQTVINIKGRRIPKDQVFKAITILIVSLACIFAIIFCLLITQKDATFFESTLEAVSAFTNVGLTIGFTSMLASSSKLFIIAGMIIGRIGSLTLVLALRTRNAQMKNISTDLISYPEERIMLG